NEIDRMRHECTQAVRGDGSQPVRLRPHREAGPHRTEDQLRRQQTHRGSINVSK
ncbi:hypothetical protein L9F63_027502, partial [Diploptera punctata]